MPSVTIKYIQEPGKEPVRLLSDSDRERKQATIAALRKRAEEGGYSPDLSTEEAGKLPPDLLQAVIDAVFLDDELAQDNLLKAIGEPIKEAVFTFKAPKELERFNWRGIMRRYREANPLPVLDRALLTEGQRIEVSEEDFAIGIDAAVEVLKPSCPVFPNFPEGCEEFWTPVAEACYRAINPGLSEARSDFLGRTRPLPN